MNLQIDCAYELLWWPVKTKTFAVEIQKYGRGGNAPFKNDGTGKFGYLFDLRPELAKSFLEAIIKSNPKIGGLDYIKDFLKQ